VWELDRKLLQAHALPLVAAYGWETGTTISALNMEEFLPAPAAAGAQRLAEQPALRVPRRIQRGMRRARAARAGPAQCPAPALRDAAETAAARARLWVFREGRL